MSAVSSRPKVHSVTSASVTAAALGVVAVGAVILEALRHTPGGQRLGAGLRVEPISPHRGVDVLPIGTFNKQLRSLDGRLRGLDGNETSLASAKHQILQSLAATPCLVTSANCVPSVQAFVSATTVEQAQATAAVLLESARAEHMKVTEQALSVACRAAAEDVGFRPVASAVAVDGTLRLLASDKDGRAMVTEIRSGADGMPSLETEVLGVGDGTCHGILDRFDEALARHGVRAGTPERRDTGGVCQLNASKELRPRAASGDRNPARRETRRSLQRLVQSKRNSVRQP